MTHPVMSRSQRRVEKKQTWMILVLIVLVAGASFVLGVLVGQKGGRLPGFGDATVEEVHMPPAAQVVPVPPEASNVPEPEPAKLTFYDNLPKGEQVPLGSGINLPPEEAGAAAAAVAAVEPAASKPVAVKPAVKPSPAPQVDVPPASSQGAFVVQVASFKTEADARKYESRLGKFGLATFRERADLGAKGVWFRVLSGPYADRAAADQVAVMLKEREKVSALVRKR